MESSPEAARRRAELERLAPVNPKTVWRRGMRNGREVVFLCGTLGVEFDVWQRRLSVSSAADALFAQQIGLEAVEKAMDAVEAEARAKIEGEGRRLSPRRSPGYGDLPIELSREILDCLEATKRIGVSLTESNLLVPSKSVTAVCEIC